MIFKKLFVSLKCNCNNKFIRILIFLILFFALAKIYYPAELQRLINKLIDNDAFILFFVNMLTFLVQ